MKKISKFLWFLTQQIFYYIDSVFYVLVSFKLWESGQSYELIFDFNLFIFATLIIGGIIFGLISSFVSIKLTFLVGLLLKVYIAYLVSTSGSIADNIIYISSLIGFSYAAIYNSSGIISMLIVPPKDRVSFSSLTSIFKSIGSLAVPISVALLTENFGFGTSSNTIMIAFIFIIFIFLPIYLDKYKENFVFPSLLTKVVTDRNIRSSSILNFSIGVSYAFAWGILNIVLLDILGSIESWSQISFFQVLFAVIVAYIAKKIGFTDPSKTKSAIIFSSMIYAIVPLIMLFNFSFNIIIIFLFVKVIFDQLTNVLSFNFINNLENKNPLLIESKVSLQMLNDLFINFGQLIPIVVLILIARSGIIIDTNIMVVALALVSFVPFLLSTAFKE